MGNFLISSGYGGNTKRPFVQIEGPSEATVSPDVARELAANLLQAAEAADGDGFLFEFFSNLEPGDEGAKMAAALVVEYRGWREAMHQEKYGGEGAGQFPRELGKD